MFDLFIISNFLMREMLIHFSFCTFNKSWKVEAWQLLMKPEVLSLFKTIESTDIDAFKHTDKRTYIHKREHVQFSTTLTTS